MTTQTMASEKTAVSSQMISGGMMLATAICMPLGPVLGVPLELPGVGLVAMFVGFAGGLPMFVGGCIKLAKDL